MKGFVPAIELARAIGISRKGMNKRCERGVYGGAVRDMSRGATGTWMVPLSSLSVVERKAIRSENGEVRSDKTGAVADRDGASRSREIDWLGLVEGLERGVCAVRCGSRVREGLRLMGRGRVDLLRRGVAGLVSMVEVGELWGGFAGGEVLARWGCEGEGISERHVYRVLEGARAGRWEVFLGRATARLAARGSRVLGDDESSVRELLKGMLLELPTVTPVAVVHRALGRVCRRKGLSVPPGGWTRREVGMLEGDRNFQLLRTKGERGLRGCGVYIKQDKTTIRPGAVYVVDHRQFDVEVVARDGRLVRPWHTLVVCGRTLLPMSSMILEGPPNGDSVMVGLCGAMLPWARNEFNGVAGAVLESLCGVPDDYWLFDHGKDFENHRVMGMREKRAVGRFVAEAHGKAGDVRSGSLADYCVGLLGETETGVRQSLPYNARGKIVERVFRDVSLGFDVLCPGYVGNKPTARPAKTEAMRKRFGEVSRVSADPGELASATGYLGVLEFERRFEAWLWDWVDRDSRAQGLEHGGRRWRALDLWEELAVLPRRVLDACHLERLSMEVTERVVDRGTVLLDGRRYWLPELCRFDGRRVAVRFSRTRRDSILVEGVIGDTPFPEILRVPEMRVTAVGAGDAELGEAMARLASARREMRGGLREGVADAGDLLMDLAEEVAAAGVPTGRGQIVSLNGRVTTPVVSVKDVWKGEDGRVKDEWGGEDVSSAFAGAMADGGRAGARRSQGGGGEEGWWVVSESGGAGVG